MNTATPDIEVYILKCSQEEILLWLRSRFPTSPDFPILKKKPAQLRIRIQHEDKMIPVLIIENASDGFASIWFDSADTPWGNDQVCAQELANYFNKTVRVTSGSWTEDSDPDLWWQLENGKESYIHWPTHTTE